MAVRADGVVSEKELVGGLMEIGVCGRKIAKMRKGKVKFPKEEAGVSFYEESIERIEKEGVAVETRVSRSRSRDGRWCQAFTTAGEGPARCDMLTK